MPGVDRMTEEPVYECEHCGTTLERQEQGVYTYCRKCRLLWDSAFMAGFQHARDMLGVSSIVEMKRMMENIAPYKADERRR